MTEQLKRTLVCNAAAPSGVSRSVVLKEAVLSEEMSVAMETVSAESTDLGPFFGLPSKVKDLMLKLRGIRSLYGEWTETQTETLKPQTSNVSVCLLRLAGDVSEPGLCAGQEESDLLSAHQRRQNSGRGDPRPQRAAVQEERLSVRLTVHIAGAGEGGVYDGVICIESFLQRGRGLVF